MAQTDVPDLACYRRVALQWAHQTGFELHIHEFGADYSAAGHVWNGSPTGAGMGTLIQLGQSGSPKPRFSEVYTISSIAAHTARFVSLSIETAVSPETCDRDIEVQVPTLGKEADLAARDIVLSLPGCEAVGDFLVSNNLGDAIKIAPDNRHGSRPTCSNDVRRPASHLSYMLCRAQHGLRTRHHAELFGRDGRDFRDVSGL